MWIAKGGGNGGEAAAARPGGLTGGHHDFGRPAFGRAYGPGQEPGPGREAQQRTVGPRKREYGGSRALGLCGEASSGLGRAAGEEGECLNPGWV